MRRVFAVLGPLLIVAGFAVAGCTGSTPPGPVPEQASVFLTNDVTADQRIEIDRVIRTYRLAGAPDFESREEAYARFQKEFSDDPDLLAQVRPEALPESFVVVLADRAELADFKAKMETLPGVDTVILRSTVPPTIRTS